MIKYNIHKLKYDLYIILLGVASSFSLPPYNLFIINFFTFSLFFIYLVKFKVSTKYKLEYFKIGWLFGFGYFISNLYWISISLTFDDNFKFLTPFSIILVPAFMALFYGLVTYIFSYFINKEKIISSVLIYSIIFGSVELMRGYVLTGFPWNLISYSFSEEIYFIQILSLIGTYSFNIICITLFTIPSIFSLKKSRSGVFASLVIILIGVSFLIFGYNKIKNFNEKEIILNNYKFVIISSNISLDRFYSNDNEENIINELIFLSNPVKNEKTIFIWPEGLFPDTDLNNLQKYSNKFSEIFDENHYIVLGINNSKNLDNQVRYFNSLAVINNKAQVLVSYDKNKLVPFGEFLPFENILKKIGAKNLTNNYQSYSSGDKREIIDLSLNGLKIKFLPLICYELIYSGELSKNNNFNYIINISEDGWFGDSIGPHQHFAHAIFRSIESGKYLIRSANNGISAVINPIGKVISKINIDKTGKLDFEYSKIEEKTIFSVFGNKTIIFIILIYILLIFSFNKLENE